MENTSTRRVPDRPDALGTSNLSKNCVAARPLSGNATNASTISVEIRPAGVGTPNASAISVETFPNIRRTEFQLAERQPKFGPMQRDHRDLLQRTER